MPEMQAEVERTESICAEADRLVSGPRRDAYGHPLDDYTRTAGIFNALTGRDLTAREAILFMICVKLSREVNVPKRDNRVDGAGYFQCLDLVEAEVKRREATQQP